MAKATYGTGTLFKRGRIWYVSFWVDGRQIQRSSRSTNIQDAKRLRDQILGKKARGEMGSFATDRITCNELLDDLLEHAKANIKASTAEILELVIEASLRPFFGYREGRYFEHRKAEGVPAQAAGGRAERGDLQPGVVHARGPPSTSGASARLPRF